MSKASVSAPTASRSVTPSTTVRTVGGIMPADLLATVVAGTDLPGLGADDYHLELGLSPREAANRAWAALSGAWAGYRQALGRRPAGDPAVGLTRDKWLSVLLRELDFGRVPLAPPGGIVADGKGWPVSHCAPGDVPIHLLGWNVDLDRRTPGMAGAAERAPHSMLQELLNRSDKHLWGLLANGHTLRVLRDSSSLVGPSFVEFDLEAMFDGELFSDFVVLYLVCHQSRFEPTDASLGPASCWLERWRTHAAETGTRALGALRLGVRSAIETFGTGLLSHPSNASLRAQLDTGDFDLADFQRGLLRLVYRLLFCFVAEDRNLLLDPEADPVAAARYNRWFSTARLRNIATRRVGDNHGDMWQALSLVLDCLGKEEGGAQLGIPALGGIFEPGPADLPAGLALSNRDLLAAIRHLCVIRPDARGPRRVVDYRHLGAEELGGIYESLLEYIPRYDPASRTFTLVSIAGNDRKKTGAYYTPSSLTESLLDTALDQLLDRAERATDPDQALLALTVCDPACGSGHFLVAAGRRIAARLAAVRADGSEPSLDDLHTAMHEVVARCLYGVDLNPLAAELAKVNLWLEGLQAGQPLSLLDAHIKVGNALIGTTPALLAGGIPDDAFAPIEGDDKKLASALKARNRKERAGQGNLLAQAGISVGDLADRVAAIQALPARSLADIHFAAQRLKDLDTSPAARRMRLVADAWCAAFVLPKTAGSPELTQAGLLRLEQNALGADPELVGAIDYLTERYRFFHWHLEYPQIFNHGLADPATGWSGGFDCVLGNPPWDQIQVDSQEFFARDVPRISEISNFALREHAIAELANETPDIYSRYTREQQRSDAEKHFIHASGRFPLTSVGRLNTAPLFAELFRHLMATLGRAGIIVPTGIATDSFNQQFFRDLVSRRSIVSLFDFENTLPIFDGVHRSFKFCLLTLTGSGAPKDAATFAFFAHHPDDLVRVGACFHLTPQELTLLNPNTSTCPVFRYRRDAEITLAIYRRHPVLVRKGDPSANPWGASFQLMFMMNTDARRFRRRESLEHDGWKREGSVFVRDAEVMLPLVEAKMIHQYDHRWATYVNGGSIRDSTEAEHHDPDFAVMPQYWVRQDEVDKRLVDRWSHQWLIGFRDICRSTDERTLIASIFPFSAVGNSFPLLLPSVGPVFCLAATLSSLAADFIARLKVGGTHMNFFILEQIAVPAPTVFSERCPWSLNRTLQDWIEDRLDELIYTADDMAPAAWALGDDGAPFVWDPERRALLRAELDGAFFHIYDIERDDVDYILSTFPIVNSNDIKQYGDERTRRLVLEAYDRISAAREAGIPFVSALDPPPGEGPRHFESKRIPR